MPDKTLDTNLEKLLELSPPQVNHSEADWQALENELGGSLPEDYRELCRRYPLGHFFRDYIVPTGLAKYGKNLLKNFLSSWENAMSQARRMGYTYQDEFKIAPGNLIPVASTIDGDVIAWHVTESQPWPLVILERSGLGKVAEVFHGTATEFFLKMHERPMPFKSFEDVFTEEDAEPGAAADGGGV